MLHLGRASLCAGLPRDALPDEAQRGALRLQVQGAFHFAGRRRLPRPVTLTLHNQGTRTWPGLDPDPEGLVHLRTRFLSEDGREIARDVSALLADVPPGTLRISVPVAPPAGAARQDRLRRPPLRWQQHRQPRLRRRRPQKWPGEVCSQPSLVLCLQNSLCASPAASHP